MPTRVLLGALLCALLALPAGSAFAARAPAASAGGTGACGQSGYSYAGLLGRETARGVSATLRVASRPDVSDGHVAAWIGFGGYGAGPGGSDAWIQAGVITRAGEPPSLYFEVARPGEDSELVLLRAAAVGRDYRLEVIESSRETWSIFVDGKRAAAPVRLPGSHDRWEPTAVAESWDGGRPVCNRFAFRFSGLGASRGPARGFGTATTLADPGYRVTPELTGFRAYSGSAG